MEDIFNKLAAKIDKTLEFSKEELSFVRTGRANPLLIEGLKVEAYGTFMNLRELATISAAAPQILYITPWDQINIEPIIKALQTSNLNLLGSEEGGVIRVPIPLLSRERREELVRLIGEKVENAKISIRQSRHEAIEELERREKAHKITQDQKFRGKERAQKLVDEVTTKIENLHKQKENELREI